jgi:hypothetical protein
MRPARLCVFPFPLNPKARGTPGRIALVGEAQILRANPNAPPAGRSTDRTFASNIRWERFVSPELERSPPHRGGGRAGQRPCDQSISGRRDRRERTRCGGCRRSTLSVKSLAQTGSRCFSGEVDSPLDWHTTSQFKPPGPLRTIQV